MAPRSEFGITWWGRAWVAALESLATLDPNRLSRGRTYVRKRQVHEVSIGKGHVSGIVQGSEAQYYRVDIGVRQLAEAEWEQVAEAIAAKATHAAALLDGELDPAIVDDVAAVDVRLMPGAGDLRPDCNCLDWAEPCKHAAAVCFVVAEELDRDPFVLFKLRGRSRDELMAMVRAARGGGPDQPAETIDTVAAADAWAHRPFEAGLAPPPEGGVGHHRPAQHTPWEAEIPRGHRVDTDRVDELAVDAAQRALAMLNDGSPSGLRSDARADLARRASATERGPALVDLAARVRVPPATLKLWAEAWRLGGDVGVAVLSDGDTWSTDADALEAGRQALVELGYSRRSVAMNYDSLRMRDNVWLVIGPDRRWYRLQGKGKGQELHLVAAASGDVCDLVELPDTGPGAGD